MASRVDARPSSLVSAAACVCEQERERGKIMMPACVAEQFRLNDTLVSPDDLYPLHADVVGNGRRKEWHTHSHYYDN